jgi:carbamoyltransferase
LYGLLSAFAARTGCPVLINTSLNVRGEPIVLTPGDAYHCLMSTGMDALVLQDVIVYRDEQPAQNRVSPRVGLD